ncbi:MAG: hypothetical protein NC489_15055 [Ruminococcus flavefaciens]|nr:hypothetical protein [Roseburia sp.]MCM1231436.1 hypothetical protein [Ruminococcus flavefaciens]
MKQKNKYFMITIDTEGDNLWEWQEGTPIGTENVRYLSRFQDLCDRYQFKPIWLTNWEMANDDRFVTFAGNHLQKGQCEIGMHLHAWNTPPFYELPRGEQAGLSYLIEYPSDVMREKVMTMTGLLKEKFGKMPVVHRAGRWGMNDEYFKILHELGYIVDCSITPYADWRTSIGQTPCFAGPDYTKEKPEISIRQGVIEIPVTTWRPGEDGRVFWLRPNRKNLDEMLALIEWYAYSDCDYLMFMLHSSELMPGGSPTFRTEGGIEILYKHLQAVFKEISLNYMGVGLEEYVKLHDNFSDLYGSCAGGGFC